MTKRFYARGSDGVVAIVEGGATSDTYINTPLSYIDKVHFHSNFNYMKIPFIYTLQVNFPTRTAQYQTSGGGKKGGSTTYPLATGGSATYLLGSHNLGYKPGALWFEADGLGYSGNYPVQKNGISVRLISLTLTTSTVSVYESYLTYNADLPAISKTFSVLVFKDPE